MPSQGQLSEAQVAALAAVVGAASAWVIGWIGMLIKYIIQCIVESRKFSRAQKLAKRLKDQARREVSMPHSGKRFDEVLLQKRRRARVINGLNIGGMSELLDPAPGDEDWNENWEDA